MKRVQLEFCNIDLNCASKIPEHIARKYTLVAIGIEGSKLQVAMKDPFNIYALEDLRIVAKMEIQPVLADETGIWHVIEKIYTSVQTKVILSKVEKQFEKEIDRAQLLTEEKVKEAPTIQFVNNILECGILRGASDLHIEPLETSVRIRYRVDGQLYEFTRMDKKGLGAITSRIKVLAGLDITERRLPQDGRISKMMGQEKIDLRVSILPTIYGEKTVVRFIYGQFKHLSFKTLGFHPEDYGKAINLLKNPYGIILVAGPTGSGKSTTLATALKKLNKESVNVVTVEDPVENIIKGVTQIAVNHKIGLTFSKTLRAILRQDPDIIMIGEMRDSETSQIAVRAAITGHLVFSTLHTNDAASAIIRLIDMGIEAYMVSAAVKGIISQRLVRKLCPVCRKEHYVTASEALMSKIPEGTKIYKAVGCSACYESGYKGRLAVHEIIVVDKRMQEMISTEHVSAEELKSYAIQKGMRTLWDNAYYNVLEGNTSLEEMMKIVYAQ